MVENNLKELLFRFYFDAIETARFEENIYECSSLEEFIGSDDYIDLISVDYKSGRGVEEARRIVKRIYDRKYENQPHRDYAVYVAKTSLVDGADIVKGCELLSNLSIDYEYVDSVFCGYHDELQSHPDQLDFYKDRILEDFKQLLIKESSVS